MSVLNLIIGSAVAHVLTDSLMYDSTGVVRALGRKCEIAAEAGIAVAARGDHRWAAAGAATINQTYDDIDDLIEDRGELLTQRYEGTLALHDADQIIDASCQWVLVGWSKSQERPLAATLVRGQKPDWEFSLTTDIMGPMLGKAQLNELQLLGAEPGVHWQHDTFDPIAHGLPMVEAQRRMKVDFNGKRRHIVGGELLLTTVRETGVEQHVIHSWDDEIGEAVTAAPFVRPVAEAPAGTMSRQQRRARERAARKAA